MIRFWNYTRMGCLPLVVLQNSDGPAMIRSYLSRVGNRVVWGPTFRRNLLEIGAIQLNMLLSLLEDVYVQLGRVDRRVWEGTIDGSFTVKTFFYLLDGVSISLSPFAGIWKLKAPPRVVAFAWLALSRCI